MKTLAVVMAVLITVAVAAFAVLNPLLQQRLLEPPDTGAPEQVVFFEVRRGAGAIEVTRGLLERKLIRSEKAFLGMLRDEGWAGKLKPGLYRIEPGTHARDIARAVVNHDIWRLKVTVPEGLDLERIARRIERAGQVEDGRWLPRADDIQAAATAEALKQATGLEIPTPSAEGYLFPDTYLFPAGADAQEVVTRMMQEFARRFLRPHEAEIARHHLSAHELVTLASIVEREAEVDRERPLIAQVFINRLNAGMRLESCATVQYALPEHKPRLLFSDLRVDSPYNTYIHAGLPPGPICSPGEPSLLAALRPQRTDALYFVSRGDGTHRFSRTMQEHEQAIRDIRGG